MPIVDILNPIIVIVGIALLVTQCFIPTILGRPWFPLFRRSEKLRTSISIAWEDKSADVLEQKLTELRGNKDDKSVSARPSGVNSEQRTDASAPGPGSGSGNPASVRGVQFDRTRGSEPDHGDPVSDRHD